MNVKSGSDDSGPRPEYVAARRVLLDALEALAPHRSAFVVAGAQAVYLRTCATEIGIAPYTTDGDLALDPLLLSGDPQLEDIMNHAGFRLLEPSATSRHVEPGIWTTSTSVAGRDVVVSIRST